MILGCYQLILTFSYFNVKLQDVLHRASGHPLPGQTSFSYTQVSVCPLMEYMASVSVCVIMLPHIPQLLTVHIDTAQENVQLMQPEFIYALGTASWVKLWNCSLGRSLSKPALILYI